MLDGDRPAVLAVTPSTEGSLEPWSTWRCDVTCFSSVCGQFSDVLSCQVQKAYSDFEFAFESDFDSPSDSDCLDRPPHAFDVHGPKGSAHRDDLSNSGDKSSITSTARTFSKYKREKAATIEY